MRQHVVFLPVVVMVALTGCQTTKTDTDKAKAQAPSSQSERLVKLADDIDARGDSNTAIALYQRAAAMPDAKPIALVKAGEAYMRAGYPDEAAKAYQAALAKAPKQVARLRAGIRPPRTMQDVARDMARLYEELLADAAA